MAAPAVSVVVPARDAAATLPRTLAALAGQDHRGPTEIIVVDDGSTDETAGIARAAGARVVSLEGQHGPAGARNAGIAAATGELLAFTDADCVPAPGWLAALVAALVDDDLVTGPVAPDPGVPVGPFDRTLRVGPGSPWFETANLAVRRTLTDALGGFRPFVPGAGAGLRPAPHEGHFGEDAVFGWTARRHGARIGFAAGALVHHAVVPRGARDHVAEKWRMRFFPALVREVPELRTALPARTFVSRRTARFDLAVAAVGLAARRRSVWPLLLTVPYVRSDLRTWALTGRGAVGENAALILGDAVGLAALVRGAVAARRVVL